MQQFSQHLQLGIKATISLIIETNNNIRTVQSESSKFASLLFDQIPNRRVVGTDQNASSVGIFD